MKNKGLTITLKPRGKDTYASIFTPDNDEIRVNLNGFLIDGGMATGATLTIEADSKYSVFRESLAKNFNPNIITTSRQSLKDAVSLLERMLDCDSNEETEALFDETESFLDNLEMRGCCSKLINDSLP